MLTPDARDSFGFDSMFMFHFVCFKHSFLSTTFSKLKISFLLVITRNHATLITLMASLITVFSTLVFDDFLLEMLQIYEQFCILSMNTQRYGQFKSAEEIAGFIEECLKKYPFPSPQLTLVVHGLLKLRKEKVSILNHNLNLLN